MRVIAIRGNMAGEFGQVGTHVGPDDTGIILWEVQFDNCLLYTSPSPRD